MCLVVFALDVSQDYPLVFAANRDELHERPSAPADWWKDYPGILGGRDLLAGGSWLAVNQKGWLATVTNLGGKGESKFPRSRGHLVRDYLATTGDTEHFDNKVQKEAGASGPFNLMVFDGSIFHYFSNRAKAARLGSGIHAISNAQLGTGWPKIHRAKHGLAKCLKEDDPSECLFKLLSDTSSHEFSTAEEGERMPHDSTLFVRNPYYGTRSSTVILRSTRRELFFIERRFNAEGELNGECSYSFTLDED